MALSRKELDITGCATPNCDHDHSVLYLHSACHPKSPAVVSYHKANGTVKVQCAVCEKLIVDVKVAD